MASEYGGDIDALAANIVALQRDTLTSAEFQKRIASLGKTFPDHAYINTAIQKAHSATSNATTGPLSQNQKAIAKVSTEVKCLKEALQPHMEGHTTPDRHARTGKEKSRGESEDATDGPKDGKQEQKANKMRRMTQRGNRNQTRAPAVRRNQTFFLLGAPAVWRNQNTPAVGCNQTCAPAVRRCTATTAQGEATTPQSRGGNGRFFSNRSVRCNGNVNARSGRTNKSASTGSASTNGC